MAFTYEDLKAATFHNNRSFVSEWLRTCTGDEENKDEHQKWMGSLLGVAAYHHSVDVVSCVIDYITPLDNCKDILNSTDLDGKAPLHHAAEGSKQMYFQYSPSDICLHKKVLQQNVVKSEKPDVIDRIWLLFLAQDINLVNQARDLLNIIGCLFTNGADPTVKSNMGFTPREIAAGHKFKIGSALLEILENIWLRKCVSGKGDKNKKVPWHKELLQWAVENAYENIVMCILRMNLSGLVDPDQPCTAMIHPHQQIVGQDLTTMEFLLRTTEGLYANDLIHIATNVGNLNMLKAFIICSGLHLNVVINKRWKQMLQPVTPNEQSESGQTSLSLALSHPSYCNIINAMADLQVGNNITHIDLSNTMIDCLPKELFNFHSIINLNVSNNHLKQVPFAQLSANLRPGQLSDLNLSNNHLSNLPVEIFNLPNLKYLDASNNPLTSLPDLWWLSKSLIKLNVSNTKLTELCLWKDADQNFFKRSGRLASIGSPPPVILNRSNSLDKRSCLLKVLNVSFSCLRSLPNYLACYFPNLQHLNVSNNNIALCCAINELPEFLEELDISNNKLQSKDCTVFSVSPTTNCCYLNTEINSTLKCMHMRHSKLSQLRNLNLANNEELQKIVLWGGGDVTATFKRDCLFFPKLTKLVISNCGLLQAPVFFDRMNKIYYLDISKNLMKVPHEVHNLESLMTFIYDGLPDPIVADLDKFGSVKEQQMFLMQKDATSSPTMKLMFVGLSGRGKTTLLKSLRFMGRAGSRHIITIRDRLDSGSENMGDCFEEVRSTIGVDQELWCYARDMDNEGTRSSSGIAFYAWDFAGQEEYSAAHQCFVTENSLYVLCWRACDKDDGILELKDWLLTIKARTKSAVVVIVGTHIDKIKFGPRMEASFVRSIKEMYSNENDYPPIKAIEFVSCEERYENTIKDLRNTLYDIASETKLSLGSRRYEQKLMDIMIPNKYLTLQKRIIAEAGNFRLYRQKRGPPILSWNQILEIGEDYGFEEEQLVVAIKYLKNQGILMHFDSLALQDYYFLDSQWLCDMFAHVISTEYNHTFVTQGGKADRQALEASLKEKFCISTRFMEPIIMLLNKFELAIPLDKNTFLIPSLLQNKEVPQIISKIYCFPHERTQTYDPSRKNIQQRENSLSSLSYSMRKRAGTTVYFPSVVSHHRQVHKQVTLIPNGTCFRRVFVADHILANFWPRLIARFLSSAHSFHAIICDNCSPDVHCENLVHVGDANIGSLKCGWSYGKNYITLCLGDDVLLCVNALCSFTNNSNKRRKRTITSKVQKARVYYADGDFMSLDIYDGFEVTIPDYSVNSHSGPNNEVYNSELMSTQILSYVLETIDEVLRDWFDGLSDRGIYSEKYLTHFVPCPYCYDGKPGDTSNTSPQPKKVKNLVSIGLSVKYCLLQARMSDHIKCPNCGELSLKDIAPDLVFEDKKFQNIDPKQLRISTQPLGQGGFGAVFKAVLLTDPPQDVALKCFTKGMGEPKTITLDDLSQTYADVRMEFNKLVSIDHPHIVRCIGFSVISMAFVLELAPQGSLKTIMNSYRSSGYYLCPNSLIDTIKQVSMALDHLHTKKMIAHYDIKPDNILVFNYPPVGHNCFNKSDKNFLCTFCKDDNSNKVLVKLADLGVAAFVGPGGFRRRPATPGHTAPEAIKYGGKEALMEKVDIFSLGITLFELMTLRFLPPPEMSPFDFDSDIRDGIRPRFYEEDPNYPAVLKELVFKCWAQDYAARPSAEEIVSLLQSPDCLKLSNVLRTELPYSAVSAAVVVTVDDQQSLWLAHSIDDQHKVTVYELSEGLSSTSFNKSKSFNVEGCVQTMCQAGIQVWIAFKHGNLKAVDAKTFNIENQMKKPEAQDDDDLVQIVSLSDRNESTVLAIAYKSGTVLLVKSHFKLAQGIEVKSFGLDVFSKLEYKISTAKLVSSQLCSLETCKSQKSHLYEVWCGCNNGAIEIITPSDETFKAQLLNTHNSSADIPQNASIIQLKFSFNTAAHMMYALHSSGRVVSCWSVCEQPTLNAVIKLTQLTSPANMIIPIENTLIITDVSGTIHELNLSHTIEGGNFTCKQLPSYHQPDTMMQSFCLHGKMTPQGFLFSIGNSSPDKRSEYVNIFDIQCPSSLPCIVLLGLRAGYNFFQAERVASPSLYFTTWVFPNTTTK